MNVNGEREEHQVIRWREEPEKGTDVREVRERKNVHGGIIDIETKKNSK